MYLTLSRCKSVSAASVMAAALCSIIFLGACAKGGSQAGTPVELNFPSGYSYDKASHALYAPSGKSFAVLPGYVTSMTLTISGEDQDVESFPVDLSTLSVVFTVSPGIRTFTISVTTDIGLFFTDSITLEVVSGKALNLKFNLNINAPPQITQISADPQVTVPGTSVSLFCAATDLDPEDQLTYQWAGPGGFGANGQQAAFVVPNYGSYELTCIVSDGWGGVTRAVITVAAPPPNRAPVVRSIDVLDAWSMTVPTWGYWPGMDVVVQCNASDYEGDAISYAIFDQYGTQIGSGPQSSVYTLPWTGGQVFRAQPSGGGQFICPVTPFTFACWVSDRFNPPTLHTTTIMVDSCVG